MAEAKMQYDITSYVKQLSESLFYKDMEPKKIIKSGDRTIVFWKDDTKTIVKRSDDTADDLYSAFCAALAIKIYGSNSQVKKILRMADIQPMSDRMRKKEAEEYRRMLEARKAREEAERPQKILDEYIDKDPIGTAMEEHKAELQKRLAEQINEGISKRRRRRVPV